MQRCIGEGAEIEIDEARWQQAFGIHLVEHQRHHRDLGIVWLAIEAWAEWTDDRSTNSHTAAAKQERTVLTGRERDDRTPLMRGYGLIFEVSYRSHSQR